MVATTNTSLDICIKFLREIGISVNFSKENKESFLPGIEIFEGDLYLNPETLEFAGDILHEAGHIAVVPIAERATLNANTIAERQGREAEEMMAIAWSYAASIHLGLPASFVFHEGGYKGGGSYLAENFNQKRYIGLPMLQYHGFCYDEKNALLQQKIPFPHMYKWVL